MADSRPSGLASEVLAAELASLYDTLIIPVDDPSYSPGDIKKIKAKTLLTAVNQAIDTINTTLGNKANTADVLLKTNTTEFIPTGDYNPATRKFVTDKMITGTFQYNTPWSVTQRIVSIGQTLASADYTVILETATPNGFKGMYPLVVRDKTTTTFTIQVTIENSNILEQPLIRWTILR